VVRRVRRCIIDRSLLPQAERIRTERRIDRALWLDAGAQGFLARRRDGFGMTGDGGSTRFVQVGDTSWRVRDEGTGPPLLLMAGIGGNIEMWKPLSRLIRGRRLISFDAPGAGASAPLPRPVRMRRLAALVAELLDVLGRERTDVLGYSFGGALAQQFARDHGERVRRLILAGTLPGLGGAQHPARVLQVLRAANARDERERLARVARLVGGRSGRDPAVLAVYERNRQANPPTLEGYRQQMRTISGWSSLRWLPTLCMPTLALAGEHDPMAPAVNTRIFTRRIPDCRRHVVPGAGHLFLLDQPEDVVGVIETFLDEPDREPASTPRGAHPARRRWLGGSARAHGRGARPSS
jgi:poly(3-hydroxyoctanoate) depolymerase